MTATTETELLADLRRDTLVVLQTFDQACRRRFLDLEAEAIIEDTLKSMLNRLREATL